MKSHTGDPCGIASYGPLMGSDGRLYELSGVRPASGGAADLLIVRVVGVSDRAGAEALNRVTLSVPRASLAEPEDEDEFLLADLVGLRAVDADGTVIGTIVAVPNFGGGDLLEIRPAAGGATALLPFTKAFVPSLDLSARHAVIDPPEDLFAPASPRPAGEPE